MATSANYSVSYFLIETKFKSVLAESDQLVGMQLMEIKEVGYCSEKTAIALRHEAILLV